MSSGVLSKMFAGWLVRFFQRSPAMLADKPKLEVHYGKESKKKQHIVIVTWKPQVEK